MNFIPQVISQNRFIKVVLISLIIIALILALLPFAIQWGVQYTLKEQGASEASVEDINVNLFKGQFELIELKAVFNKAPELKLKHVFVDVDMAALWDSKVIVENVLIDGLNADIKRNKIGEITINGYQLPSAKKKETDTKKESSKALDFALQSAAFTNSTLKYTEQNFTQNLVIKQIKLNHLISWKKNSPAHISALIIESKTTIKAEIDAVLLADIKSFKGELKVEGLNTKPYKKFYQQYIQKLDALININAEFDIALGEQIKGNIKHTVALNKVHAQYQQLDYKVEKLTTSGQTQLDNKQVSVKAKLALDNSELRDLESSTLLKSFKHLALNQFHFDENGIRFNDLTLTGINLLENKTHKKLLGLDTLSLKQLNFDMLKKHLTIKEVELQQPDINATLSEQKRLTHLALIEPILKRFNSKKDVSKPAKSTTPAKPMQINIEKVRLTKPGLLHFNDLSVSPHYSTTLHFNKIDIDGISNEKPAKFSLALKQGEYTTIDITGQGLLFKPTEDLTYTVDIKQLDLPPVSAYTTKTMGYGIKSGVVDSIIKGSIKLNQIDTRVELSIDSIEVIETDKETAAEISGASGMSIGLALSTLKDKNNIIDLELPIGGDIKKPDFDLSLIINKAMGIAMKAATFSYLQHALQPFSGLVTLFNLVKDAANSISLAPISFAPNKTELVAKQKELLDKVSNILTERPGIKIKACGIASLNDQTAINTQLLNAKKADYLSKIKGKKISEKLKQAALNQLKVTAKEIHQAMKTLADTRAAAVKAYLISIKNIKSAKILNCLSAENLEKESKEVVELVI